MAGWDDGYVTDVAYTTNFYREVTPLWLVTTGLLLGQRAPDLTRAFRYADLGCGHGVTALVVAAVHPEAEVWGFDFNPAHVERATRLAAAAGLDNAHFVEASFAELAARPDAALPSFDFMVSHGVASWISTENRQALLAVMRQRLRPGGLAYVSYNVTTGWGAMLPLRRLMWMLQAASPARTDLAAAGVMQFIDRLREAGALFFPANPRLDARLDDIRKQDPRYIAHEYLNRDWQPLMFAEMAEAMAEAKCSYIGSATLSENIDAVATPPGMAPLLNEVADPVLRETLRDFGCAQAFRRDLYRRGVAPLTASEQSALLDELSVTSLGVPIADPLTFSTPIGTVTGRSEIYQPLLAMLADGVVPLRRARQASAYATRPLVELLQAITLLVSAGYVHPVLPGGAAAAVRAATTRLNQAVAAENGLGAELPRLAAPLIGSALQVDLLETLLVGELLAGRPADPLALTQSLLAGLERGGRTLQRDGRPVTDPAETQTMAATLAQRFVAQRMPVLARLGVL